MAHRRDGPTPRVAFPQDLSPEARIAILRGGALGDFLCTTAALSALRASLPNAAITLITSPIVAPLARRYDAIDRIIVGPAYHGVFPGAQDDDTLADFFEAMRLEQFDLAFQWHGGGRYSNGFVRRLGAKHTVGFKSDDAPPLDRWLPYDARQHELLRYLDLLRLLGIDCAATRPYLPVFALGPGWSWPTRRGSLWIVDGPAQGPLHGPPCRRECSQPEVATGEIRHRAGQAAGGVRLRWRAGDGGAWAERGLSSGHCQDGQGGSNRGPGRPNILGGADSSHRAVGLLPHQRQRPLPHSHGLGRTQSGGLRFSPPGELGTARTNLPPPRGQLGCPLSMDYGGRMPGLESCSMPGRSAARGGVSRGSSTAADDGQDKRNGFVTTCSVGSLMSHPPLARRMGCVHPTLPKRSIYPTASRRRSRGWCRVAGPAGPPNRAWPDCTVDRTGYPTPGNPGQTAGPTRS